MKDRLRKLRKTLDLTQQKFADQLGIKRNTVAQYEMGNYEPSSAVITLICNKYDVNENWLRNGVGEMFIKKSREVEIVEFMADALKGEDDSFKKDFLKMLSQLSEEDWKVLEKMALLMSENKKEPED